MTALTARQERRELIMDALMDGPATVPVIAHRAGLKAGRVYSEIHILVLKRLVYVLPLPAGITKPTAVYAMRRTRKSKDGAR